MANSQPFSLIDTDYIPERDLDTEFTDWFEDAESDVEWGDSFNANSSSHSITGESNHSGCLLEDIYEKNKILCRQWKESEQKYQNLLFEHQKLNMQLSNEKHRANKFAKKLQYIQENYEVFNRIKQTYLNIKYKQTAGKSMVEVKDKGCQTWQGIICASCIETAEAKRQADLARLCYFTGSEPEMITVRRSDLNRMQDTVQKLMEKINERELSWSYNEDRENRYKNKIEDLQNVITVLNDVIANRPMEVHATRSSGSTSWEVLQKENLLLGNIIVKLEKRQRDMEKIYKPEKRLPLLNAQEKNLVQLLTQRYSQRLQNKYRKSVRGESNTALASIQNSLLELSQSSHVEVHDNSFISENGSGEGSTTIFTYPSVSLRTAGDFTEQAEKPMSPKKNDTSSSQTDLIDLSEDI